VADKMFIFNSFKENVQRIQTFSSETETFEKCSILFKFKAGENFNHRNTLSILRIALKVSATLHSVSLRAKFEPNVPQ
jgi:hypothetical protein